MWSSILKLCFRTTKSVLSYNEGCVFEQRKQCFRTMKAVFSNNENCAFEQRINCVFDNENPSIERLKICFRKTKPFDRPIKLRFQKNENLSIKIKLCFRTTKTFRSNDYLIWYQKQTVLTIFSRTNLRELLNATITSGSPKYGSTK